MISVTGTYPFWEDLKPIQLSGCLDFHILSLKKKSRTKKGPTPSHAPARTVETRSLFVCVIQPGHRQYRTSVTARRNFPSLHILSVGVHFPKARTAAWHVGQEKGAQLTIRQGCIEQIRQWNLQFLGSLGCSKPKATKHKGLPEKKKGEVAHNSRGCGGRPRSCQRSDRAII